MMRAMDGVAGRDDVAGFIIFCLFGRDVVGVLCVMSLP